MKKFSFILLSLILCFSLAAGAFAAPVITVDGTEVKQVNVNGDPVPEVDGNLVPLRAVLQAMGYSVNYDAETNTVKAGTYADPEYVFTPGDEGFPVKDGTTFVDAEGLTDLPYDVTIGQGTIAYDTTAAEIQTGYYKISLNGQYLTAPPLAAEDVTETVTNEDGTTEEVTHTRRDQILATELYLAPDNGSDEQLWLVRPKGVHTYTVVNKATDLAMDVNSWSLDIGGKLIQYTLAGGTNQQFTFNRLGEGYVISPVYSKLFLNAVGDDAHATGLAADRVIQVARDEEAEWRLDYVSEYVNPVEAVAGTEAFKELDPYYQERFNSYFFTDVDFSESAKTNAETYLRQNNFLEADKETQQQLIMDCLDITYSDLLGGWMREKLTANYEIAGVTRTHDTNPEVLDDPEGKDYYVWTINMECNGPDDIHTFTVETVDENDEEHVRKVCEAVACFEPPVRKTLRHFYYTGDNFGTWNAWDGEIWNNTASKFDVDGMLTMFAHELGHVIDSDFKVGDDVWRRAINADIIPTSGYGKTNRWEDFGEFSRLYLMSRGDDERIAAIEKIYPNRTMTYRAALYNIDNDYYAQYKDEYQILTEKIGDTDGVDEGMYYALTYDGKALTNNDGKVTMEKDTQADNQLWQISVLDDQLVKLYSKADGKALFLPNNFFGTAAEASFDGSTAFGLYRTRNDYAGDDEFYTLIATESGYGLDLAEDGSLVATMLTDAHFSAPTNNVSVSVPFTLTPVEKVEGMGEFYIMSDDQYLAPGSSDLGAQLCLLGDENKWSISKLPNNVGYITDTDSGYAIDISGVSMDEGASALAYTLSRNANQTWLIIDNGNGTVSFQAQHSGLYLAVDEDGMAIQSAEKYEWTLVPAE